MNAQSTWIRKGFWIGFQVALAAAVMLMVSQAWAMSDENARLLDQAQWHAEDEATRWRRLSL